MTVYVLCFFQMTTSGPMFKYVCYHTKAHEDDVESADGLFPMILCEEGAVSLTRAYDKLRQRCPYDPRLKWLVPYLGLLERGEKIYSDTVV
jgi:hypothetical protein